MQINQLFSLNNTYINFHSSGRKTQFISYLFAHLPNSCKGIILVFYMFYEDHKMIMRHGIKDQKGTRAFILTCIRFVFNTIPTVFIDQFF